MSKSIWTKTLTASAYFQLFQDRNVMKKLLFIFIVCNSLIGYSQTDTLTAYIINKYNMQPDIDALNDSLYCRIGKDSILSQMRGLKLFHIYEFTANVERDDGEPLRIDKENFYDYTFLNEIKPTFSRIFGVLYAVGYIYDSAYNIVAKKSHIQISRTYRLPDSDQELFDFIIKNKITFVFVLSSFHYLCVKDNAILVIDYTSTTKDIKVYTLKEFVECCYSELIVY
ncbi:MAG: hypothetical protein LBL74_07545 [Bacteroidales bacterium]|jgi:hypothetical protein|nr:hypothetical protein [Bacteroidales bacterium]